MLIPLSTLLPSCATALIFASPAFTPFTVPLSSTETNSFPETISQRTDLFAALSGDTVTERETVCPTSTVAEPEIVIFLTFTSSGLVSGVFVGSVAAVLLSVADSLSEGFVLSLSDGFVLSLSEEDSLSVGGVFSLSAGASSLGWSKTAICVSFAKYAYFISGSRSLAWAGSGISDLPTSSYSCPFPAGVLVDATHSTVSCRTDSTAGAIAVSSFATLISDSFLISSVTSTFLYSILSFTVTRPEIPAAFLPLISSGPVTVTT